MNVYQKLGIVGGSLSFAVVSQCFSVQAATLTQTYTVDMGSQPLNSSTNVVLPKFNSLLGTLLRAYVTVKSTVNNSVSITPLTEDFMGTAASNASIAVNIPLLKVDPNLTLSVLASPPETRIANGATGSVSGSASGTVSKSYDSQQSLSAVSGCDGDTFIAALVTTGFTQVTGNPVRGSFGGLVSANTTVSAIYEYEPIADASVPEPMTAVGTLVAAGMGLWWKKRVSKRG